jgi:hypothetical protein
MDSADWPLKGNEMPKKKIEINKSIEILYKKMREIDVKDSYGILVLKTGMVLKINNYFELLLDQWNEYKQAKTTDNKENLEKVLKDTGGILSNGDIAVDIDSVMAMISVYQMEEAMKENFRGPLDDFLRFLESEEGDSKPPFPFSAS